MKKKLFLAAAPALVLAGGFLFFACSTVSPVAHGTYTSRAAADSTVFTIEPDNSWSIAGLIKDKGTYEISEDNMAVTLFTAKPVTDDNGYPVIEVNGNEGYTKTEPVKVGTATFSTEKEFKAVKVVRVSFSDGKKFSGNSPSRD